MSCTAWWISRHKLWNLEIKGLLHAYGKHVAIKSKNIRFKNATAFLVFLRRAQAIGAKPFVVVPEDFKIQARNEGLPFGVIRRPLTRSGTIRYHIEWYSDTGECIELFDKSVPQKGNKRYRNTFIHRY